MLFVTLILFPLVCLYILIRAHQERRRMNEEEKKRRKEWDEKHPIPHIPGYRQL